jgi:hypothetical protein
MIRSLSFVALVLALGLPSLAAPAPASTVAPIPLTLRLIDADREGWIVVEARYARVNDRLEPKILVNGMEAISKWISGGQENNMAHRNLAVAAVSPGEKRIRVELGRENAEIVVDFQPRAAIKPLWIDRELVGTDPVLLVETRFTDSLVVRVNGVPVEVGYRRGIADDLVTLTAVASPGALRPGDNEIVVSAVGRAGEKLVETSTIVSAPDSRLAVGAEFRIVFGHEGSRSGPFFQFGVEGVSIEGIPEYSEPGGDLIARFRVIAPGKSRIVVRVKHHFMGTWELEREIPIEGIAR